jgi:hypothetical protein
MAIAAFRAALAENSHPETCSPLCPTKIPPEISRLTPQLPSSPNFPCHNAPVSTLAQINASRANGAKSRGPITPEGKRASAANSARSTGPKTPDIPFRGVGSEGKARSSRNAAKHAVLAQSIALPNEKQEDFIELLNEFKEALQPIGILEERAVETMAVADWRCRRVWCVEMAQIAHATLLQEQSADDLTHQHNNEIPAVHTALAIGSLADNGRALEYLRRCEAQYSLQYRRARAELKDLQAERREHERLELEANLATDDFIDPTEEISNRTEPAAPAFSDSCAFMSFTAIPALAAPLAGRSPIYRGPQLE